MMQGGPSIISSRMFARDDRPVPNIVAIYERPRLKVRRDATHVMGGMFGWNAPEEMARALRNEDSPVEDSTASIPNSASADPSLSGTQQRCVKRPTKRSKRRSIIPLAEMGASILSLSLQERMSRRQEGEKEHYEPVSALVKPSTPPLDVTSVAPNPTLTVKKIKVAAPGDAPTAKKLRLTISTAPPASTTSLSTPLLQLPLSPPDTSSNASKAPADDRFTGLVVSSTPRTDQLMPNFDLDLSTLGDLSLSTLDSDSDSDSSSSESSSESGSDSPDLSSSTSTRSASQDKAKGKGKNAAEHTSNNHDSRNSSPSFTISVGDPSTPPPRRKRRTHPPGWVGWVQTEESPDHSRLIRLDDVPVILGRRTRSGKEFQDPPPIRRKSLAVDEVKEKRPTKSTSNSNRNGQKSGRQNPLPEARKRGVTEESVESKVDEEHIPITAEPNHGQRMSKRSAREPPAPAPFNRAPEKAVAMLSADTGDTTSAPKRIRTSLGESTNAHQPARGTVPSVAKSANALPTPKPSSASIPVLKLTRSDAIITTTGARSKEPERKEASPAKDNSSKIPEPDKVKSLGDLPMRPLPTSDSTRKDAAPANSEKPARLSLRGTAQSQSKGTNGAVSRPALGTSNSSILINNAQSTPTVSNPSPDSNVKRHIPVTGSSSKNVPISVITEKARTAPRNPAEKSQPTKAEPTWGHGIQPTPNSDGLDKLTPNANSSTSLKTTSFMSRAARPFPMALPSRTEKSEPESKPTPFVKLTTLGKRKDSSSPLPSGQSSSSSQSRVKKRKLALSSSDESEGPRFIVNPFDRRAKKLELTRKGVSGDAFQAEMKKWMHAKKAEWKERERQKEKQNDRPNGNEVRTAIAEGKPVSEFVRHRLAGASTSTRIGEAKLARKKVYNSDWGMDVAKVSVAGSSEKRTQPRLELETEKRDVNGKDARESSKVKRESDTSRDLVKPRRVAF
ncbi:unnamed protein product [Rhizoctonia solani]|uniref:Uncharacterized protein n=1 Tax=Rhizoctonia solani TaxID=456999 RepID=A0A8H3DWF4_9AGAM|nr:unnamed protein product [Rhizoctonia solani]